MAESTAPLTPGQRQAGLEIVGRLEAVRSWTEYALAGHVFPSIAIDASRRLLAACHRRISRRALKVEDAPWEAWHGAPLNASGLARMLKRYAIKPRQIRFGDRNDPGLRARRLRRCLVPLLSERPG